jgi:hypothetical protein
LVDTTGCGRIFISHHGMWKDIHIPPQEAIASAIPLNLARLYLNGNYMLGEAGSQIYSLDKSYGTSKAKFLLT